MKNTACFIGNGEFKFSSARWKKVDGIIHQLMEKGVTNFLFGEYSDFGNLCFYTVGIYKRNRPEIRRIKFNLDYNEKDNSLFHSTEKYDKTFTLRFIGDSEKSADLRRYMSLIFKSEICVFLRGEKPDSDAEAAYNYALQKKKHILCCYR